MKKNKTLLNETTHRRIELRIPVDKGWTIAATVHLPANVPDSPALLFLFPGSGYSRGYFDLPGEGFSQAAAATAHGFVCAAIDYLGTGDSSIPPLDQSDMASVAAAGHAAVAAIVAALREGRLADDIPPTIPRVKLGAGQSFGGFVVTNMQANHRTFDGITLMGSSTVATKLPLKPGVVIPPPPPGASAEELSAHAIAAVDWPWVFHWDDAEGTALRSRDIAAGLPQRMKDEPWASRTAPGCVIQGMLPGVLFEPGAKVDVPVLLAMGERDVCQTPTEEVAVFKAATDVAFFVVPRMAHMHNFAATRALLWTRLEQFALQVAALRETAQLLVP